jgi:hypothetical protein
MRNKFKNANGEVHKEKKLTDIRLVKKLHRPKFGILLIFQKNKEYVLRLSSDCEQRKLLRQLQKSRIYCIEKKEARKEKKREEEEEKLDHVLLTSAT